MKSFSIILLALTVTALSMGGCSTSTTAVATAESGEAVNGGAEAAYVTKVYAERVYGYETRSLVGAPTPKQIVRPVGGTAYLVRSGSARYLVTAAHVIVDVGTPELPPDQAPKGKTDLTLQSSRVRISNLSIRPVKIHVDVSKDVALLTLSQEDYDRLALREWPIDRAAVRNGEQVSVVGFPGTVMPQLLPGGASVTSVQQDQFVLNNPVEAGYSGGPVLNQRGVVVGTVVRATERQTYCRPNAAVLAAIDDFAAKAKSYEDMTKSK